MLAKHPDSIVPAVPQMSKSKDHDDTYYLDKLGKMLTKFLENCFLAPSIKSNQLLCRFITEGEKPFSEILAGFQDT